MSRGFCAVGVDRPKKAVNVGTLWRSAALLDASYLFTVGRRYQPQRSDTRKEWRHCPLIHFADVDDLVNHLPREARLVGVELTAEATPLTAYHHPERACYLLGAEDLGLSPETLARCDDVVKVATADCLNVAVAGSLVLYDRGLS